MYHKLTLEKLEALIAVLTGLPDTEPVNSPPPSVPEVPEQASEPAANTVASDNDSELFRLRQKATLQ